MSKSISRVQILLVVKYEQAIGQRHCVLCTKLKLLLEQAKHILGSDKLHTFRGVPDLFEECPHTIQMSCTVTYTKKTIRRPADAN